MMASLYEKQLFIEALYLETIKVRYNINVFLEIADISHSVRPPLCAIAARKSLSFLPL